MGSNRKVITLSSLIAALVLIVNMRINQVKNIKPEDNDYSNLDKRIETTIKNTSSIISIIDFNEFITPIHAYGYIKNDSTTYDSCSNNKNIFSTISAYQKVYMIFSIKDYTLIVDDNNRLCFIPSTDVEKLPETYIETNLSERKTSLVYQNKLINEYTVTIGSSNNPTDEGYFQINEKTYNRHLDGDGYHTYVNFFFPYNMGEGFHDLPGYSNFGEAASHGCTRMKYLDVKELDKYISEGTKVLVHK